MKKHFFTILVMIAAIITFSASQSSAQRGGSGFHPRLDSAFQAHLDSIKAHIQAEIDSFKAHHPRIDSILVKDSIIHSRLDSIIHAHIDSIHAHIDSIIAHHKEHHDSIPPVPHDSVPPAPHDSIPCPHPGGHGSIPPAPHDSLGCGGHGGNNGHGRRVEVGDDVADNTTIGVYPNPLSSNSVLHIANSSSSLTFRMFDMSGKIVVMKENLTNGDYSIGSSNLGSGMYFYDVYDGNTKVSSGKLLVQ